MKTQRQNPERRKQKIESAHDTDSIQRIVSQLLSGVEEEGRLTTETVAYFLMQSSCFGVCGVSRIA